MSQTTTAEKKTPDKVVPRSTLGIAEESVQQAVHHFEGIWGALLANERFRIVGHVVRDRMIEAVVRTVERYKSANAKTVYYLSMEFLIGRSFLNNLINLGMAEEAAAELQKLGVNLHDLAELEHDAALGNGGLGRLAACFLDSLATMDIPAWGFGIMYEYGLFKQLIRDGRQVECPDNWLTYGNPWLIERPERAVHVRLYGRVINADHTGGYRPRWVDTTTILGVPHDFPIAGFGGRTVNLLRLFSARAPQEFDMRAFNEGHYLEAVSEATRMETINKVLYPNDSVQNGPELRLIQEYFLVACAVRTILEHFRQNGKRDLHELPKHAAIQLNDTHPALTVAELMRLLVDDLEMPWNDAWQITTATCAYTNHTLMPEALEKWPVPLFERILPRHLEIIYEINRRHLDDAAQRTHNDGEKRKRLSLVEEGNPKHIRMAYLAIVGSHSVNGVAAIHSELVKKSLVPDFYELAPEKFNNKTNGVTPRRWLRLCNPGLSELITETIGDGWVTDLDRLRALEPHATDKAFQDRFLKINAQNKQRLSRTLNHLFDDAAILDCQIKRIHLYKRQLLNVLHIVYQYLRLTEDGYRPPLARTCLFAGKAAPGYFAAKEVIYLINRVAQLIDNDKRAKGILQVIFAPDYRVTLAESIIPAADLSEQISTAGTEASGTSNMKFGMNGALTIGTLDGANVEIRDEVGVENIFIFGNTVEQIETLRREGRHPRQFYDASPIIRRVMDAFRGDRLSPGEPGRFYWVYQTLVEQWDPYFHLADFEAYLAAHEQVAKLFADPHAWAKKAILNVARMGKFSSDRSIREYARDIWKVAPVQ